MAHTPSPGAPAPGPRPSSGIILTFMQPLMHLLRSRLFIMILAGLIALEAIMPAPAKPSTAIVGFFNRTVVNMQDSIKAIDTKWAVILDRESARIARETNVIQTDMERLTEALDRKMAAVDRAQLPALAHNFFLEYQCVTNPYACEASTEQRRQMLEERGDLLGDFGQVFSKEELLKRIGTSPDFMKQFETGD